MFTAATTTGMSPWEPHCLLSSAGTLASSILSHSGQLTGVSWSPRGSHSSQPGVPTPQPRVQHSSALGTWQSVWGTPSTSITTVQLQVTRKHLGSITQRAVDGKVWMCWWGTGSAAWAKEKSTEKFRDLSEPSWTWTTCKGITEFLHWAEQTCKGITEFLQFLLAQPGIHNIILILYMHPGEILLNDIFSWHINVLCLPPIFFHNFFFTSKKRVILLLKHYI